MDPTVTLTVELAPGPGPIAGVLRQRGERLEFSGWIELVALIEARRPAPDGEGSWSAHDDGAAGRP